MRNVSQYPRTQKARGGYNLCSYSCYICNEEQHLACSVSRAHFNTYGYPNKMVVVDSTTKTPPGTGTEIHLTSGDTKLKLLFTEKF